jgi:tetratricopeptide (TPR) repeat protein
MTGRPFATFLLPALVSMLINSPAAGQEELRADRKIEKYRTASETMTESVYRRLSNIQEELASEKYDEVIGGLQRLSNAALNDYEEALVLQTFGFAYIQQNRLQLAVEYFEKSLALESLPGVAQQGMLYSLASLYLAEERFQDAIDTMRTWFRYEADPVPDAYMVIATSFVELQQFDDALPYVQKALEMAEKPREQWYMLELAIYFEKESFRSAVSLLKKMLKYWPDNGKYWDMLASSYLELKQDKNALDTMMVAYANGLIEEKNRLMTVVQLNLSLNIPFTAGTILEKEIAAGRIDENKKNLEILLQAWISAKEYNRAAKTINRLGALVDDGEIFMRKAGIHNELGEWSDVIAAVEQALQKGLEDPADAHVLAGMAYTELKQYDDAVNAFRQARNKGDDKQRRNATEWISYVQEKMAL